MNVDFVRPLRAAIHAIGGQSETSRLLGISQPSVWGWLNERWMPDSEFSGKTNYASQIAKAATRAGKQRFTAKQILDWERRLIAGDVVDPERPAAGNGSGESTAA